MIMKKFVICLVLVFLVLRTSCFAQSGNDAQRIVGTWKLQKGTDYSTITFNSNGTYSGVSTFNGNSNYNGNYFINGSKLIRTEDSFKVSWDDFYISPNGRILVIGDRWFEKQ